MNLKISRILKKGKEELDQVREIRESERELSERYDRPVGVIRLASLLSSIESKRKRWIAERLEKSEE